MRFRPCERRGRGDSRSEVTPVHGRDPGNDGSGDAFCSIESCSQLASAMSDAGVPGAQKCEGGANVLGIIGGAVGGAFGGVMLIIWIATYKNNNEKKSYPAQTAA